MRFHTDTLTTKDLHDAARVARVDMEFTSHGSRSRDHAYNIRLLGESRRRPNSGKRGAGDDYAATWDQWGVFISYLFDRDPYMTTQYYADLDEFQYRTDYRFNVPGYWPSDAHGDHRFKFNGVPRQQECTKCSAVTRWS